MTVGAPTNRLRPARLLRSRSGSALMELALAAPVVTAMLVGLFEFSRILFVESVLEGGLREAARFGITGSAPDGQSRQERILEIVGRHTLGMIDLTEAEVSILVYQNFDDVGEPEPFTDDDGNGLYDDGESFADINGNGQWDEDMGEAGLGGAGDVVLYSISYRLPLMLQLLNDVIGKDGKFGISASIVVRNEPYDVQ